MRTHDLGFINVIISIIATSSAIVSISIVAVDRQINSIEKRLYSFYYPLEDHLEAHLIPGMKVSKRDIE
jgi:hypothetical protein